MIGLIAKGTHDFVKKTSYSDKREINAFLSGYREAAGLVSMGVCVLPVIISGQWPFSGAKTLRGEARCLVSQGDGSDNDEVYESVLKFYPEIESQYDEVVVAFIPEKTVEQCPMVEACNIGRLSACFDIAAWFVDSLPHSTEVSDFKLGRHGMKALSLGVFVNILVTRLYFMSIVSRAMLVQMRSAICGIIMEKLSVVTAKQNTTFPAEEDIRPVMFAQAVRAHMRAYPGLMCRLSEMLCNVSDELLMQASETPDRLFKDILDISLSRFYGR